MSPSAHYPLDTHDPLDIHDPLDPLDPLDIFFPSASIYMNPRIERKAREYTRVFPQVEDLSVRRSTRADKRLMATFTMHGQRHTVHFGDPHAYVWADGAPISKRASYRARASRIVDARGRRTYRIAGTANSFAYHVLW